MKAILAVSALTLAVAASAGARQAGGTPVALVTAEQQNEVLAVGLPSGKVLRRVSVAADPQNVAAAQYKAVVVSPGSGAVTLLDQRTLKTVKVLRGFGSPHLAAISPFQKWAYVTDDARGQLDVIALGVPRVVARVFVGLGAHHIAIGPRGHRAWIALGEHASQISIVDLTRPDRPRLIRRFSPGFAAHDLAFSPEGDRVWVTSDNGDSVHVLSARTGREAFSVRVGAAPQHVAFADWGRHYAYATSGYSDRMVKVDPRSGRVLATATTPHGSFNLSTEGSLVVTTSLLDGNVTEFDTNLRRLMTVHVANAARGVALTLW